MSKGAPDLRGGKRTKAERLPPHSQECEQGVLACCLINPAKCIAQCSESIRTPEVFFDLRHQTIFKGIVESYDTNKGLDVISLQQWLKDRNLLEQVGGITYLAALPDTVPSYFQLPVYLETVLKKFMLREAIRISTEAINRIYDREDDADGVLDDIERQILSIRSGFSVRAVEPMKNLISRQISAIEDYHNAKGQLIGLGTGFTELDKMTMGLCGGEMVVLSAYPSVGKTSLATNIVEHVSIELKQPCGVFSLEMSNDALAMRLLCSRSRVNIRNVREGFLAERDFPKITGAAGKLSNAPIYIDDTSGLSIFQFRAKARRMWQEWGIKLFVIDYLQLMSGGEMNKKNDQRSAELELISRGIKNLAKELKVPVIVLSQLNDDGKLKGSRAAGEDGDHVWRLRRVKHDEDEEEHVTEDAQAINLEILKQRNGPTGTVHLTFLRCFTRFESAAKVSQEDYPGEPLV
jgi:replicative DNA helicase